MRKVIFADFVFILGLGIFAALLFRPVLLSIDMEKMHYIVNAYVAFDLALLALIPATIGLINANVKSQSDKAKKRDKKLFEKVYEFVDGICNALMVWCSVLFIASIIVYITDSSRLFWVVSAFEFAVLFFWTLWSVISLKQSWPKTFLDNTQKQK